MTKLQHFLTMASAVEIESLAEYAGTSPEYLTHLARGYGGRKPNVVMAVGIEQGTKRLALANPALPVVTCHDLANRA